MGTISEGPVFLMVLAIITNFLVLLFSCEIRTLFFESDLYLKWIVGYFALFFIVFLGNYQGHHTMKYLALISIFYYAWFIALMKVHPNVFFLVMAILAVGFMTDLYIEHHSEHAEENHLKMYKDIHKFANYLAFSITVVGFAHYYATTDKKNMSDILFNTACSKQ